MSFSRWCRRLVVVGGVCVTALVVTFVCAIQVDQRIARRRAERLLANLRLLEIGKSTNAEAERVFGKPNCRDDECNFSADSEDMLVKRYFKAAEHLFGAEDNYRFALRPYRFLGGRPAVVSAFVTTRHGTVSRKAMTVYVEVPPGSDDERHNPEEWLVGSSVHGAHGEATDNPLEAASNMLLHPDYMVGKKVAHPNLDTGGGITATVIWSQISPRASPTDVARLMDVDLSCLTGWWHTCRVSDLMPGAWTQYLQDERLRSSNRVCRCTAELVEKIAPYAQNAAVGTIVSDENAQGEESGRFVTARLSEPIIQTMYWKPGDTLKLWVPEPKTGPRAEEISRMHPSSNVVLMFDRFPDRYGGTRFFIPPCGALPLSGENLAMVKAAVGDVQARMTSRE